MFSKLLTNMLAMYLIVVAIYIKTVKSAIFFPSNSAYGIFAALAVPLDLGPHRNVFISYNFEANYNLPANWQLPAYLEFGDTRRLKDKNSKEHKEGTLTEKKRLKSKKTKPHLVKILATDNSTDYNLFEENQLGVDNVTEIIIQNESISAGNATISEKEQIHEIDPKRERRSLLSRKTFYSMLKQRLHLHGFNGQNCLLRLICETNDSKIGEVNGFLGSILHIIFAPSSSKDEGLPTIYYKAEFDGQQSQCQRYQNKCQENILDFISTPVLDIINSI